MLDKVDFRKSRESGTLFIWVIGGPGSGKTTLCTRLAQSFSFWHISVSELLNNLVAIDPKREGDEYTTLKKAKVIPTSIILFLIKQEMATHTDKKGFLIDGFPLDVEQGIKFEKEIVPVDCILFLKTDENTMIERIYIRSTTTKGKPDRINTVCGKMKAFREFEKKIFEKYSTKIQTINANLDLDAVQRKASMKINDLIIKHFTMKILQNNNLLKVQKRPAA